MLDPSEEYQLLILHNMVASLNKGTQNTMILIIGTPEKVPLYLGNAPIFQSGAMQFRSLSNSFHFLLHGHIYPLYNIPIRSHAVWICVEQPPASSGLELTNGVCRVYGLALRVISGLYRGYVGIILGLDCVYNGRMENGNY